MSDAGPARGTLENHPLPLLLLGCYRRRTSAALMLRREAVEKRVLLREGVPVMAESNLPSESLGIQLLDAGRITRDDYARVVEIVKKKRCKEGAALLALELLPARELFEALKLQVRRRLLDCFGWSRGSFAFEADSTPIDDATAFRCDPIPLVQEGLAIHWTAAAMRAALGAKLDLYLVATPRSAGAGQRLYRDPAVERLLAGIGGAEPLGALLDDAPSTALAAAVVLDGIAAVSYSDHPAAVEGGGEEDGDSSLDIEVVISGTAKTDPLDAGKRDGEAGPSLTHAGTALRARELAALRDEIRTLHAAVDERNHYELLGLARNADPSAVRSAYVAAAKRFHPDAVARAGLAELRGAAEALFARIAQAHEVLADPARRRDYDIALEGGAEDQDTARLVQAESLYRKGEILLRAGNFAGALDFLRPCVALWPEDTSYQSALGWALYKRSPSDPKAAREHLEKAVGLDAQDAIAHFRLGMVLRALGEEDDAATMLARAKRLDPKVRS